jgi:hypothetical protein
MSQGQDDAMLSEEFYSRWEHLIEDVEIKSIPLRLLSEIEVTLDGGVMTTFMIPIMMQQGLSVHDVEKIIAEFLDDNDDNVEKVEFNINIPALAKEVGNRTDGLLG